MAAIDYLEQFQQDKVEHYSELTIKSYVSDLKQFYSFVGKEFEDINRDDIKNYVDHVLSCTNLVTGKSFRPQTVNKKLIAIRQFIEWINANTDTKIFVEIKLLEIQRQDYLSEDLLSVGEFERIIHSTSEDESVNGIQARALLYGLYYTGMRISELLQMKVSDVQKLDVWIKGKGEKYREIPISQKLKPILHEYITAKNLKTDDCVFMNLIGTGVMSRQSAHRIIKKYAGKAKIKLKKAHLHNLRHLFCITMLQKGATIEEVADLAGHSNINTTRIYARKTKGELRSTVEKL